MDILETIKLLESKIKNPEKGLPYDFFLFISRMTPLINVDLLIKDKRGRTLLAWRDDKFGNKGWHIPGGIVRYKEKLEHRIQEVAKNEIGVKVKYEKVPIAYNEIILKQKTRGHSISFLFRCKVPENFIPLNKGIKPFHSGYLKWHNKCPKKLIKVHEIYRKFINER
jgi:colanic acid biosynthesis protein WcaH